MITAIEYAHLLHQRDIFLNTLLKSLCRLEKDYAYGWNTIDQKIKNIATFFANDESFNIKDGAAFFDIAGSKFMIQSKINKISDSPCIEFDTYEIIDNYALRLFLKNDCNFNDNKYNIVSLKIGVFKNNNDYNIRLIKTNDSPTYSNENISDYSDDKPFLYPIRLEYCKNLIQHIEAMENGFQFDKKGISTQ